MIVSAISNFRAIAMQHDSAYAMMKNRENSLSMLRGFNAGETNFNALHQQDLRNSLSTAKQELNYKYATEWKKHSEARLKKEMQQNKLNYLA